MMTTNTNTIILEICWTANGYRVFYNDAELSDDELLDILWDSTVRITFVCADTSVSLCMAQAEQGTLVYWDGLSRDFEPNAEEISLFVLIANGSSTTTRTPKVKVRPPIIKPAPVFMLG